MSALRKLCRRLKKLSTYEYGLSSYEEALISFLVDNQVNITPLFYNSAIPIKELFYFFVIAGNSFREFVRIPNLFIELQKQNAIVFEQRNIEELSKVRWAVRNSSKMNGVLIKLSGSSTNEEWRYITTIGQNFEIKPKRQCDENNIITNRELRKRYGGEFIRIKLLHKDIPTCQKMFSNRLFKPEQYIPFYFIESDLNNIDNLLFKITNMFYAYTITRYRMIEYYSSFTCMEFMKKTMKKVEKKCENLKGLKNDANIQGNCFKVLCELNQIDVLMMNRLKEKLERLK